MSRRKERIDFEPIPCENGNGHIALSIYPPRTWFDNTTFCVFVGGCGVGDALTRREAEKLLLLRAQEYLLRRIQGAQRAAEHYDSEFTRLRLTAKRATPTNAVATKHG